MDTNSKGRVWLVGNGTEIGKSGSKESSELQGVC